MGIDITIRQRALIKKELPLEVIVGEKLVYGAYDGLRTNPGQMGEREIIVWNPDHIGRGFSVQWKTGEKKKTDLRLPLPSTDEEIEDFYETVRRIAQFWQTDVEEEGQKAKIDVFMAGLDDMKQFNSRMVAQMADQVFMGEKYRTQMIPAVMCPLHMGMTEARIFAQEPEKFGAWLHEKQSVDAYYPMPQYYDRKGETVGRYVLTTDVPTIFPRTPQVPFGFMDVDTGLPLVCERYEIVFRDPERNELFALMEYDEFLNRVDPEKTEYFDGDCFLLQGMTAAELRRVAGLE